MKSLVAKLLSCAALLSGSAALAQYAPAVGNPGTSAIYKDSSVFVNWATGCNVVRGYMDISNTSVGYASAGDSSMALGIAGSNGIVSLGDSGYATMTFQHPIADGPGWDFAVFENSFNDDFLELGFVEVSSDGEIFFRFPAHSLTDTTVQTGSFGSTDATKINNLAGKYRAMYGTPFDLSELSDQAGLNIMQITHVRIVDVIGNVSPQYATRDTANNPVNDPWPTAFSSGGFDLDAVGVIYENPLTVGELITPIIGIFPNPTAIGSAVEFHFSEAHLIGEELTITDATGALVHVQQISSLTERISTEALKPGAYFVHCYTEEQHFVSKWLIVR